MIQKRISSTNESHRIGHQKARPKTNDVWKQDESLPCPCPGSISPLTTVSVVKDFLLRQGMDNESWRFTNVKDMYLPSAHTNGSRQNSACLRAISVPLTPRKESLRYSTVNDSLTNLADVYDSTEGQKKQADTMPSKMREYRDEKCLFINTTDHKISLKKQDKESRLQRAFYAKKELFTLPKSGKKYKSVVDNDRNCNGKDCKQATPPTLSVVRNAADEHMETSVGNIFDLLDESNFLDQSRKNANVEKKRPKNSQESRRHSAKSLEVRRSYHDGDKCEVIRQKSGVASIGPKSRSERQRHKDEGIDLKVREERLAAGKVDALGITETQMYGFEEPVKRFNEASPLISGFNRRYPNMCMSLKYLVNHLNHKKMVKKFYGIVGSQQLNANFTPDNVLKASGTVITKRERIQSRRIKWLAAATDAFELETGGVITRIDKDKLI